MSKLGICKLCLLSKELRYSHLIPEFCYKPLYDPKHRATEITLEPLKRNPNIQKGYREYLLCDGCEGLINDEYEKYFLNVWYKQKKLPDRISGESLVIPGLNYKKFKLFHLSILWRAGISSRSEFAHIKLGKRHDETLRKMILNGDPGPEDRYSFFAIVLTHDNNNVVHEFIM